MERRLLACIAPGRALDVLGCRFALNCGLAARAPLRLLPYQKLLADGLEGVGAGLLH